MTDQNDLRKIEKWLPAMLTRAFHEGFSFTREGWNGECAFDHLAPDGLTLKEKAAITVSEILADHDAAPAVSGNTPTLTDEEREAVEWSIERADWYARVGHWQASEVSSTLRKMLERLGGGR